MTLNRATPVLLGIAFFILRSVNSIGTTIAIEQGLVKGTIVSNVIKNYTSFLGIPYGTVDVNNPFGPALPPSTFDQVFEANQGSIVCPQVNFSGKFQGQLDCLRLNVLVPNTTHTEKLPVLLWIHGGGFEGGGAQNMIAFVQKDIILVSITYRLGVYGFMCLDIPAVPGNQGLKDQHLAVKWVKNNIAVFGGDPDNIVLGGQSADAASIDLHLYSPHEKLFSKLVMQSGSAQVEGMFINPDTKAAIRIANSLGLSTTDSQEAVKYLSTLSASQVVEAAKNLAYWFRPCQELQFEGVEIFVRDDPFHLNNAEKAKNTPILIGYNSREQIPRENQTDEYFFKLGDPFLTKIKENFKIFLDLRQNTLAERLRHFYIGDMDITKHVALQLIDFESDFYFNHAVERSINGAHKNGAGPIYHYVFGYVPPSSTEPGVSHGGEMKYFSDQFSDTNSESILVKERLNTMWSNFIKYGNPTPQVNVLIPVKWEPVTCNHRPGMFINGSLNLVNRIYRERMTLWDIVFDNYETEHIKYNSLKSTGRLSQRNKGLSLHAFCSLNFMFFVLISQMII